jgi:hypothetical protein
VLTIGLQIIATGQSSSARFRANDGSKPDNKETISPGSLCPIIMSHAFSIYGLSLLANRPIPGIPPGSISSIDIRLFLGNLPPWLSEVDPLSVEQWYTSEYKDESGNAAMKVFRLSGGEYYWFRYADETEFLIDQTGSNIWAVWPETLSLEDTCTYLLGPVMGFVLLLRGSISLHASAIAVDERAIALVGPAGAGKSTTAAAFAELGYSILAEDVVTLDDRGASFLVQPAYPCIRLWPASVTALFGEHTDLPKLTPNWEKRYLDLTQQPYQFHERALPLAAIYLLEERADDSFAPFVRQITETKALMSLVANTYSTRLMDKMMRAREFEILGRLLKTVPVRQIIPHASTSQIPKLCKLIREDYEGLKIRGQERAEQEQFQNV